MIKIGITGSLASGKTVASRILSFNKGPLFSADKIVQQMYKKNKFKAQIKKRLNIPNRVNLKKFLRLKILKNKSNIKILERILHPLVRKEMIKFTKKNKKQKFIFFEIPLLVESKLMKHFDVIFFIKAKKNIRLKRFHIKGGSKDLFEILNSKQLSDAKKAKYCNHVVVNEKNLKILKRNLLDIFEKYE